jgi:PTS system nitrogen regulatory IIA component
MILEEIIKPDSVLCNAHARSKKHCLEILSELLVRSNTGISSEDIFESLVERERLGCTSLDQGVAFPHCRVKGLDTNIAALIKLSEAVEFDSPDGEPVDLIFGLMVPDEVEESHQADVCDIAELLGDRELRVKLRDATSSGDLHDALIDGYLAAKDLKVANGS